VSVELIDYFCVAIVGDEHVPFSPPGMSDDLISG
jgi:hypothetical protein